MTSSALIGLLGFVFMMILIALRCPVFLAMLVSSLGGMLLISSPTMVLSQFTSGPFTTAASYTFALLPLFMLMGVMTEESGIAAGAFTATQKWLGRSHGGLLKTVVVANAIFGACSGVATAGCVVFSRMALPSLDEAKYDRGNALACIAASSCLSSLIPPSVSIIMSCMITGYSITRGLLSGVGAGIMTTVLLLLCVEVLRFIPGKIPAPSRERVSLKEKLSSLKLLVPIIVLFVIIIGGSYSGFFTATVGGAIGSMAAIIYAIAKKMPIKRVWSATIDAACMNASIFPLMLAGTMFGRFITLTKLPDYFINLIAQVNLAPILVFTIVVIFYLICGCLMDMLSIILITVPIIFPILESMGFEPYALLILLVYVTSIGGITPPIGLAVFTTSNAVKVDSGVIFKGVIPYFIVLLLSTYLIVLFPQIVTFLPNIFA